jgi:hypothetical protein
MKLTQRWPSTNVNLVGRWGSLGEGAAAQARSAFMFSLTLSFAALVVILTARHQLSHAARMWQSGNQGLGERYLHLGTWLLYVSWILAIGSAECLRLARRRPEVGLLWAVAVLLGLFLYLNFAP